MLPLNGKEQEMIELLCKGKSTADIAIILGNTPNTVANYLPRLYAKLDAKNRAEACANYMKRSK